MIFLRKPCNDISVLTVLPMTSYEKICTDFRFRLRYRWRGVLSVASQTPWWPLPEPITTRSSRLIRMGSEIGLILWMRTANEGRRYKVTSSLIGRAHSQNDPWEMWKAMMAHCGWDRSLAARRIECSCEEVDTLVIVWSTWGLQMSWRQNRQKGVIDMKGRMA